MSKHETLLTKLLNNPKDFTYSEAKTLLNHWGYIEGNKGKTSGSAVKFYNPDTKLTILLHKPHPSQILKPYQVRQLIAHLQENGMI